MLVFIDESGDSGLKLSEGSSTLFTVALVVFEDAEEATACDIAIQDLRKRLKWTNNSEFHFMRNSNRVRSEFMRVVSGFNFFYYGIVINKRKLYGPGFKVKDSFYKYATGLVFENAKVQLSKATVVIDKSGSDTFRGQLSKYLKRKMNEQANVIHKVKMQDSQKNNLLQLADYVASSVQRHYMGVATDIDFRKMISHREIRVQVWPK